MEVKLQRHMKINLSFDGRKEICQVTLRIANDRSDCASAQADVELRSPLTELLRVTLHRMFTETNSADQSAHAHAH